MYRAHRRCIGPRWISRNPDEKVKQHKEESGFSHAYQMDV
jgi:hypothetical protein